MDIQVHRTRAIQFWKARTGCWVRLVGILKRGLEKSQRVDEEFLASFQEQLDKEVGDGDLCDALDRVFFGVGSRHVAGEGSRIPGFMIDSIVETPTSANTHFLNDLCVIDSVGDYLTRSLSKDPPPTAGKIQGVISWMLEDRNGSFRKMKLSENGVAMSVEDCGDGPFFKCDPVLISRKRNQTILINTATLFPDHPQNPTTLFLHRLTNCTVHILGPIKSLLISSCKGSTRITTGPITSRLHIHRCGDVSVSTVSAQVTVCVPSTPSSYTSTLTNLSVQNNDARPDGFESMMELDLCTEVRPLAWMLASSHTGKPVITVGEDASHGAESPSPSSSMVLEPVNEKYLPNQNVMFGPLNAWYSKLGEEMDNLGWDRSGRRNRWNEAVDLWRLGANNSGTEESSSTASRLYLSLLPPSKFFPSEIPIQYNAAEIHPALSPQIIKDESPSLPSQVDVSPLTTIPIPPPKEYAAWSHACTDFVRSAKRSISVSSDPLHPTALAEAAENPSIPFPEQEKSALEIDLGEKKDKKEDAEKAEVGIEGVLAFRLKVEEAFREWIGTTGRIPGITTLIATGKDLAG
ncbi:hypothetical protein HDU67_002759 [Dinochytrium kinnereticum]|nr:hypothetical protein HDU67_002759 [Dinochytrium kinnereticum]